MLKLHVDFKVIAGGSGIVLFNAAKPPERLKTLKYLIQALYSLWNDQNLCEVKFTASTSNITPVSCYIELHATARILKHMPLFYKISAWERFNIFIILKVKIKQDFCSEIC